MPRARRSRASSGEDARSEDERPAAAPAAVSPGASVTEPDGGEGTRWRALALAVPAVTALVVAIITVGGPHLWGGGTQQAAGGVVTQAPTPAPGGDALVLTVATTTFTPTGAGGFRISVHGSAAALRSGEAVVAIVKVGASKRNWIVSGAVKPDAAGRWHAVIAVGHRVVGTMTVTAVCVGLPTEVTTHSENSSSMPNPRPSRSPAVPASSSGGPTPKSSRPAHHHSSASETSADGEGPYVDPGGEDDSGGDDDPGEISGSGDSDAGSSGTSGSEVTVPLSRAEAAVAVRRRLEARGPNAHGVRARSRAVVVVVP